MANYATLKSAIQQVVKTNGNNEITGALLQQSLLAMINSLGGYYQFAGIATPSTNPGTPDQNVFYLASTAGTYSNFGSIVIAENEAAILKYNGTWTKDSSGFATSEKVNQLHQDVTLMGRDVSQLLTDVYDAEQSALSGADTDRQVINSSGVVTTASNTNYHVVAFDVSSLQGQSVKVTANTNWGNCLYAIYDGNNNLLSKSSVAPSSGSEYRITDEEIALPFNAVTLYVAYNVSWGIVASVKYDKRVSKIEELENIIDVIPTEDKYVQGVENVISGKYISPAGVITNGGVTYTISNNVAVTPGQLILITASTNWGNALYAFYASDNTVVQVGTLAASSGTVTEIVDSPVAVPVNAAYVVAARNTNSLNRISVKWKDGKQLAKRFSGKKWVVVGDSLTEENSTTTKHYFDYVAEDTGIETVNMGVGGTGYMRGKNTSQAFYQRISSIETDADVVTIFGSFNDLNYPALGFNSMEEALGNYDDDTDATISGCINLTIENLQTAIPLVRLGIVAPCPWASTRPFQNNALMYVDRLKKIAEYHSIPFLDLWRGSNLRPWDADFRALAYTKDTGQDGNPVGTHPDETGHAILAPKFEAFLDELII